MAIPKDRCSQVTPKNLDTKLTERAQPRELRAGSLSLYWGTAPQEAFLGRSESLEIRARSLPAEKLKADELPTKLAAGIDAHSTTQAARSSWRQIISSTKMAHKSATALRNTAPQIYRWLVDKVCAPRPARHFAPVTRTHCPTRSYILRTRTDGDDRNTTRSPPPMIRKILVLESFNPKMPSIRVRGVA